MALFDVTSVGLNLLGAISLLSCLSITFWDLIGCYCSSSTIAE